MNKVMGQMWLYHTLGYVGREYAFTKWEYAFRDKDHNWVLVILFD